MKRSKERTELLAVLGSEVQEYLTDKAVKNGLTNIEVMELCVNLAALECGFIFSSLNYDLKGVKESVTIIRETFSRKIVKSYFLHEKGKKCNEERDNTSKEPA